MQKILQKNAEQRKGSAVSINIYPNRKKMSREIGLCIVLKRQEVLESFCSSCIFKIFENAEVRECFSCEVQQGMNIIGQDSKKNMATPSVGSLECTVKGTVLPGRKDGMSDDVDFMGSLMNYSKALVLSAVLLCTFLFGSASVSLALTPVDASSINVVKILSVLESRTKDRTILDKAADTLSIMEERRLRILSKLCDRISEDSDTAGADIAFSLMTVLIVLS